MKRLWNGIVAAACVGGVVVVSACSHDDSSIFIRQVMAPQGSTAGTVCSYKADPTQPGLFTGTVDVAFLASYRPVVLVGNQLISQQAASSFKTETSRVTLQGATVTVTDTNGTQLTSFSTYASGFVDPSSGTDPGWGLLEVTMIDPKTIDALRTQIPVNGTKKLVARYKVFGQTLGGQSVETNEAQFPINVCLGCLVEKTAAGCSNLSDTTTVATPCVFGQDEAIDCRLCSQTSSLCK